MHWCCRLDPWIRRLVNKNLCFRVFPQQQKTTTFGFLSKNVGRTWSVDNLKWSDLYYCSYITTQWNVHVQCWEVARDFPPLIQNKHLPVKRDTFLSYLKALVNGWLPLVVYKCWNCLPKTVLKFQAPFMWTTLSIEVMNKVGIMGHPMVPIISIMWQK